MWRKEDVIQKLRDDQGERSIRSYALAVGCSAAYISDVYNNKREPGKLLLDYLGLEKEVTKTIIYKPRRWK